MARHQSEHGRARRLLFVLAVLAGLGTGPLAAQEPPRPMAGLLWNRTGLPAVFPLQIKTSEGEDYFLRLTDMQTGQEALAAFVRGGEFFKVLVPPGTYRLHLDTGTGWQGEDRLFGPKTTRLTIDQPLTFQVRGAGRKAGHLVDLTGGATDAQGGVSIRDQAICQQVRHKPAGPPLPWPVQRAHNEVWPGWPQGAALPRAAFPGHDSVMPAPTTPFRYPAPQLETGARLCD